MKSATSQYNFFSQHRLDPPVLLPPTLNATESAELFRRFLVIPPDNLAATEGREIKQAHFIKSFDSLWLQSEDPKLAESIQFGREVSRQVEQLRRFKLHLLGRHLTGTLSAALSPTFFNHILNELEEYQRILAYQLTEETPTPFHPVHYHLLWLSDAAFHCVAIVSTLDGVEKRHLEQTRRFMVEFENLYLKELSSPAISALNRNSFLPQAYLTLRWKAK